jgi:L-amino acid N-acyltransferase YncA
VPVVTGRLVSCSGMGRYTVRAAEPRDSAAIAQIYNQGIEERLATFETESRGVDDIARWHAAGFPLVVAEDDDHEVVAWASAPPYRARAAYAGVAEFSVYVDRDHRRRGVGRRALEALIAECEGRGFWKLVSRIFPENDASLAVCRALGFREVGVYRRHGRLDGEWRDCVIVELLLVAAAEPTKPDGHSVTAAAPRFGENRTDARDRGETP